MITDIHTHQMRHNAIVAVTPTDPRPSGYTYSIGIHPWHLNDSCIDIRPLIDIIHSDSSIVAIGETGLDRLHGPRLDLQIKAFEAHIRLSEQFHMPLIIHCVRAHDIILQLYRQFSPSQPWIIHGFRGKPTIARTLLDRGIYLSLGLRFNPETARLIPADRLLIETDNDPNINIRDVATLISQSRTDYTPDQILLLSATTIQSLHLSTPTIS